MNSIPIDIVLDIFLRLPSKSIARFRCVSKLWGSMFLCPYFTELFLTRSWVRPRLLFAFRQDGDWSFFSSPQLENPYGKSSLVVSADFHTNLSKNMHPYFCNLTSGLIYFSSMRISEKKGADAVPVIFNPITGQYASLPKLTRYRKSNSFLGFDPIDKQFKVLSIAYPYSKDHIILTLGTGELSWRKIKCPLTHDPYFNERICINGVLYYLANIDETSWIVCFDVRSEKFKFIFIEAECFRATLINYKGKLGGIKWKYYGHPLDQLRMWVLEDVEKPQWSNYVCTLPKIVDLRYAYVVGVTATGEIVLSEKYTFRSQPFYVFYLHPKRNTFQRVEIRGFGEYCDENHLYYVSASVDYVEDLNVNHAKYLKSSQCLNIIRRREKLPKPQKLCNSAPSFEEEAADNLAGVD